MMPERLEQVSLIRVTPGESGQSFCERTDSPPNRFHRSPRSTCSKLLQVSEESEVELVLQL
jgi:hypothetical protein